MNSCNIVKDLLPLYVDGELSADSREMVEGHIASCPECRALEEGLRQHPSAIPTAPAARKSFSRFRRRMLLKRVLLISLCVILGLGVLAFHFRVAIVEYIADPIPCRVDDVRSEAYRLSDGSILVGLWYEGEDVYASGYGSNASPRTPGTTALTVYHDRWHDMEWRWTYPDAAYWNSSTDNWMIFLTEESEALYEEENWIGSAVEEIVLTGEGGMRLIWRKGDELPPADEAGEEILKDRIAKGLLTPRATGEEPT